MQHGTKRKYTFKYHMSLSPDMQSYVTGAEPQKVHAHTHTMGTYGGVVD